MKIIKIKKGQLCSKKMLKPLCPRPSDNRPTDEKHVNAAAASSPLLSRMTWPSISSSSVGLLLLADDECSCWFGRAAAAGGGWVLGKPSV